MNLKVFPLKGFTLTEKTKNDAKGDLGCDIKWRYRAREREWRELMAGGGVAFNRRVREGLSDKVTFAQRPEQNGGQIL